MISSAVVIPETIIPENETPTLKRKQSSTEPEDTNKKPRVESRNTNGDFRHGNTDENKGPISPISPPPRRSSLLATKEGISEEKKRGRRLFGSLLGTLSQANTKPAHKKRDEIEARQRERLRKDEEEREQLRKQKRMELDRIRRIEHKDWLREGMEIRHRNMRATAGFLRTKAEPRLFYLPWELRTEEQEQISRQKNEVEETIRQELTDGQKESNGTAKSESSDARNSGSRESSIHHNNAVEAGSTRNDEDTTMDSPGQNPHSGLQQEPDSMQTESADEKPGKALEDEKAGQDDHHGEELVEGQEDDVIY